MFTIEERDAARDYVLQLARSDPRVLAGAAVGSLAVGDGDRWSDLDLMFGVADEHALEDVLRDWTERLRSERDAIHLFDLPAGDIIYRVFLLPGGLQLDLSVMPASVFGAGGPRFKLLFGEAHERSPSVPPDPMEIFGWAVAYCREARACIERGRFWQASHSIEAIRERAMSLACARRDLPARFGRGFDDLPQEVLERVRPTLGYTLTREDLMRALAHVVDVLLEESAGSPQMAAAAARVRQMALDP